MIMNFLRLIIGFACLVLFSCAGSPEQSSISRENAISLASARVQEDGVMSLENRTPVAIEEEGNWHIYFLLPEDMIGGEPHILIDKNTGKIIEVYYTQ